MLKKLSCILCPKIFDTYEDLMHHLELDHVGLDAQLLEEATQARQRKEHLGDYIDINKKGSGVECTHCFEIFNSVELLNEHAKIEHNTQLSPDFLKDITQLTQNSLNCTPLCARCEKEFLGLITTRINNVIQHVCFNCYAQYFGENALNRITIGTPEEMVKKMRMAL